MIYLLTITLVWAAGLALYLGLLKKVPAYGFNRAFLLTTLLGGLLVPFIPVWSGGPEVLPALVRNAAVQLPGVVITANGTPAIVEATATATPWWLVIYACGAAASVGLLACSVYRLVQLYRKSTIVTAAGELTIRDTGRPLAPFSFAKSLFVSEWNALSEAEQQVLARHETAHYTHYHTVDNMLASIVAVLAWFHPLVYVLRRELRLVHEFQADAHTLTDFDSRSYRKILLRQQLGAPKLKLVAAFAQSPLKTRFAMMTNKFNQSQFWRLSVALFCLMLVVAACTKEEITDGDLAEFTTLTSAGEEELLTKTASVPNDTTIYGLDPIKTFDHQAFVNKLNRFRKILKGEEKSSKENLFNPTSQ